jgi:acyl-CoA synthetase (AMP-forming)/AMP-acid ligase II
MIAANNMASFLLEGKDPERIALRLLREDHTYGELQDASAQVALYLMRAGGRKQDRVVLIGDNSLFWVAAYLGTIRAGLVSVPLPASISSQDLAYILETTEARFAFVQSRFAEQHSALFGGVHLVTDGPASPHRCPAACNSGGDSDSRTCPVRRDELAALMFTSGSTGRPRGVMVSHGNIIANTESIVQYLGLTEADRMMTVLPFHYCFGASLLHTHLRVGASLVIDSRFLYPELVLKRMADMQCTGFAGVPSHFQILLRNSSLRKKTFPHLRYVQQAGGYLAPLFIRQLREALPGTQVFIMYGQTEATARLSYLPPELLDAKIGSIGKGIPGVKLSVRNKSGKDVDPGEIGEIVAEGENVALGYWRAPEESPDSFREGKLYTGDLATIDQDGFIYVVDRMKAFVKCGGERISCRRIEEQLLAFDDLVEAAVIGAPDNVCGEAVRAFVVPRESHCRNGGGRLRGQELKERLMRFCKERMPPAIRPKEVILVPALPKNSAGKVLTTILKEFKPK